MGKLIVTHHHPDLDAVFSAWLLVRFLRDEYGNASFAFVPAGRTYKESVVDSDEDVVHVDTGKGRFDHHTSAREEFSAGALVYAYLVDSQPYLKDDQSLVAMRDYVTDVDHFGEYYWPDPLHPRYAFLLSNIIPGLHLIEEHSNEDVLQLGFEYLDAVYKVLQDAAHAKLEIAQGKIFESRWGKAIAIETGADGAMKIAQMMGYDVVVRKDPRTGFVKVKSAPKDSIDLKPLYDRIVTRDDPARWYFHPSGHMLINGSSKNTDVEPTSLTLSEIVAMIEALSR